MKLIHFISYASKYPFLYIQITCQYIAYESVEDNGTFSKTSDSFFAGVKVLFEKKKFPIDMAKIKMALNV